MRRLALALIVLASLCALPVAASRGSIEARMDDATRDRTGIARLTAAELEALNAWLAQNEGVTTSPESASATPTAATSSTATAAADRIGFRTPAPEAEDPKVESRIVGTFRGLAPRAQITLENGQVWRSVDSTVIFRGVTAESPAVEITKGTFGGWRLRLSDYRGMAKVERVR